MKIIRQVVSCLVIIGAVTAAPSPGATVNWSASTDNGFGLADGTDLAAGSLLRLGSFTNLTDAQIIANSGNLTLLDSFFVEFATSTIGTGVGGIDAHFEDVDSASAGTLGLIGDQIFIWAFDAGTLGGASQHGIFYLNMATNAAWAFPTDTPGSDDTTIDMTQLSDALGTSLIGGATILAGGFGVGTSDVSGFPHFNLQTIPEPSTTALMAFAVFGMAIWTIRRRVRK